MSWNESTAGAIYAFRQCLRDNLGTTWTAKQTAIGAGPLSSDPYTLPTAPATAEISNDGLTPDTTADYPKITVKFISDERTGSITAGKAEVTVIIAICWWFLYSGSTTPYTAAECAVSANLDIRDMILTTLANPTTGIKAAAYASDSITVMDRQPSDQDWTQQPLTGDGASTYKLMGQEFISFKQTQVVE